MLAGVLAERASWRWIFWFLSILSGFCLLLLLAFLPETARQIVGNGSIHPAGINKCLLPGLREPNEAFMSPSEKPQISLSLLNPLGCLRIVFHKDTALVLFANAVFYMNYSCMQASLSPLLMSIYGLNALQVGLTYLPYGIACGIASYVVGNSLSNKFCFKSPWLKRSAGKIIDHDYRKTADRAGITIDRAKGDDLAKFPIEKARLRSIWYFIAISTTCTIGYGWTLQSRTVRINCIMPEVQ